MRWMRPLFWIYHYYKGKCTLWWLDCLFELSSSGRSNTSLTLPTEAVSRNELSLQHLSLHAPCLPPYVRGNFHESRLFHSNSRVLTSGSRSPGKAQKLDTQGYYCEGGLVFSGPHWLPAEHGGREGLSHEQRRDPWLSGPHTDGQVHQTIFVWR